MSTNHIRKVLPGPNDNTVHRLIKQYMKELPKDSLLYTRLVRLGTILTKSKLAFHESFILERQKLYKLFLLVLYQGMPLHSLPANDNDFNQFVLNQLAALMQQHINKKETYDNDFDQFVLEQLAALMQQHRNKQVMDDHDLNRFLQQELAALKPHHVNKNKRYTLW